MVVIGGKWYTGVGTLPNWQPTLCINNVRDLEWLDDKSLVGV